MAQSTIYAADIPNHEDERMVLTFFTTKTLAEAAVRACGGEVLTQYPVLDSVPELVTVFGMARVPNGNILSLPRVQLDCFAPTEPEVEVIGAPGGSPMVTVRSLDKGRCRELFTAKLVELGCLPEGDEPAL